MAKWDGSDWSALGGGMNDAVHALTVFDDGRGPALYAGGAFTTASLSAANRIARWDGSSWTALGSGTSDLVTILTTHDDGSGPALYSGGQFHVAFDCGDAYMARWRCGPDTTPPTISCPPAVLVGERIGSPPGEVVSFSVTTCDDHDPAPTVVCVPPSGSLFPPGTTLVTCTATDVDGNQAVSRFPVTVARGIRPP
jgi:hypothetical protein